MTQDPCKCESVHALEEDGTSMGAGSGMQEGSRTDFGPTQSKHAPSNYVKERKRLHRNMESSTRKKTTRFHTPTCHALSKNAIIQACSLHHTRFL